MSADATTRVIEAARSLTWIDVPLVFTGAATVPFHLTDAVTIRGLRETEDVDVVVGAMTYLEFAKIEAGLRSRGFHQPADAPHMARWTIGDLKLDIVSAGSLPEAAWVRPTAESVRRLVLNGVEVPVLALPYLLAAKIEAFRDPRRAFSGDTIASRDMEDMVVLLEGAELERSVEGAGARVRSYLRSFFGELATLMDLDRVLDGHVTRSVDQEVRVLRVAHRIAWLAGASR